MVMEFILIAVFLNIFKHKMISNSVKKLKKVHHVIADNNPDFIEEISKKYWTKSNENLLFFCLLTRTAS